MRAFLSFALSLAAIPVLAGGEYDRFHFGPILGLGWSGNKEFKQFAVELPGGETLKADGAGVLALQGGISTTFSFHPSSIRLGLDAEFIRTIGKEGGDPSYAVYDPSGNEIGGGSDVSVKQSGVRGTLKVIFSFRPNTYAGAYIWLGPTVSRMQTEILLPASGLPADLAKIKTTIPGAGIGLGKRTLSEKRQGIFEVDLFWQKKADAGVMSGGLTLEIKGGILF